jgi:hypothetical protein
MTDIKPDEIEEALDKAEEISEKPKRTPLPEAPASATVKVMSGNGFSWLFTMRDEHASNLLFKIKAMEDHFLAAGWTPVVESRNGVSKGAGGIPQPSVEPPICGIHAKPMNWKSGVSEKTGRPYGFWSCGEKLANGEFCPYKPPRM